MSLKRSHNLGLRKRMSGLKAVRSVKCVAPALFIGCVIAGVAVGCAAFRGGASSVVVEFDDPHRTPRESARSATHMAATGAPWATEAALKILDTGGNAFDAGMAALLALNVTYPEAASFPSVAPTMIYDAEKGEVWSYCGAGTAPAKATIDYFRSKGHEHIPTMGILAQLVPASPDAIIAILDRYGTMSFGDISEEAIRLASQGFPVHSMMLKHLELNIFERLGFRILMPYNAQVYFSGGWWRPLRHKELFRQPDLARTLTAMTQAEIAVIEAGGSRSEGLRAVRDYFYNGPVADAIAELHRKKDGLMTREDLENYAGYWEVPLTGRFGDYEVHANRTWSQGAVLPMALQILDGVDLRSMGRNSPRYVHTIIQALELAMADREAYFGDPAFVDVPIEGLLSRTYAVSRREWMTPDRAFGKMPAAGIPADFADAGTTERKLSERPGTLARQSEGTGSLANITDTSYLAVTDKWGNSVSLTPSDFPLSPMVPGTGLCLGIRMTQFRLEPDHPAALMPGKRPRITPNASMVTRDGKLFMTFGTPEGDQQPQALLQVFLNFMVFGMDIQDAMDAPRFRSKNFPDSFSPHEYNPGKLLMERGLYQQVGENLESMGYEIEMVEDWYYEMGAVCAIVRDPETGELIGGADPRQENWAAGR